MAAQFNATKGASLRSLASCIAFATSSLPAPGGPVTKTLQLVAATRSIIPKISSIRGSSPIKLGQYWSRHARRSSSSSAPALGLPKARVREARSSSSVTGFGRKSDAPNRMISTALGILPASEMTTAVRVRPCSSASCRRSRPEPPRFQYRLKVRPLAAARGAPRASSSSDATSTR